MTKKPMDAETKAKLDELRASIRAQIDSGRRDDGFDVLTGKWFAPEPKRDLDSETFWDFGDEPPETARGA